MNKLKFYHDASLKYEMESMNYYSTSFSYQIWQRYLTIFDNIEVHTRYQNINSTDNKTGLQLSSGDSVSIKPIENYKNIKSLFKFLKSCKEISKTTINHKYFLIRIPSIIGFVSGLILMSKNKPFMVEVVGCSKASFYYRGDLVSKFLSLPVYWLQRIIIKNATVTNYITKNFLQERYPTNGIAYSEVSNVHFNFDKKSDEFVIEKVNKQKNKSKNDLYTIGLVGSLNVSYKGHETALKTSKILKEKGFNVKLELVGGGDIKNYSSLIEKLGLSDNVTLKGYLSSGEEIYEWLKSLDIYIQPSLTEGHGRSLVEAVFHGCISFGTNIGGIPDTILGKYTIEKKDYLTLAELIEDSILDKKFAENNIVNNYNNIKKYSTESIKQTRDQSLREYVKRVQNFYI